MEKKRRSKAVEGLLPGPPRAIFILTREQLFGNPRGHPAHCATAASKRARCSEQRQATRQAHSSRSATSQGAANIGRAQQCGGGRVEQAVVCQAKRGR